MLCNHVNLLREKYGKTFLILARKADDNFF